MAVRCPDRDCVAPPVTFRRGGEQYIAVVAGWGGAFALVNGNDDDSGPRPNYSRLLVFKLDGEARLPPAPVLPERLVFTPPDLNATSEQVSAGRVLFHQYCYVCHGADGVAGGTPPDLRVISADTRAQWDAIVLGGMHWQAGMVGFAGELTAEESRNIRNFLTERAHFALSRTAGDSPPAEQ